MDSTKRDTTRLGVPGTVLHFVHNVDDGVMEQVNAPAAVLASPLAYPPKVRPGTNCDSMTKQKRPPAYGQLLACLPLGSLTP